jgi:hypothetical protein
MFDPDGRHVMSGDAIGGVHFLEVVGLDARELPVELVAAQRDERARAVPAPRPEAATGDEAAGLVQTRREWWPFGRR